MANRPLAILCFLAAFCSTDVFSQTVSTTTTDSGSQVNASTTRSPGSKDIVPPPPGLTRIYPRWHPENTRSRIYDVISKFLSDRLAQKSGTSSVDQVQQQLLSEMAQSVGRGPTELFMNATTDTPAWFNLTAEAIMTQTFDKLPRNLLYMLPLQVLEGASIRGIIRLLTLNPDDISLAKRLLTGLEAEPSKLSPADVNELLRYLDLTSEAIKTTAMGMIESYWNSSKLPESNLLDLLKNTDTLIYFLQPNINFTDYETIVGMLNKDPDRLAQIPRIKKCLWIDLAMAANRIRSFPMWTAADSPSCKLKKFLDCANETVMDSMPFNLFTQPGVDCATNLKLERPQALPVMSKIFSRRGVVGTPSRFPELMNEMVPSVTTSFSRGIGSETYRAEMAQVISNSTAPFVMALWLWNQSPVKNVMDQMDVFLDLAPVIYAASFQEFVRLITDYAPMIGIERDNVPKLASDKLSFIRKRVLMSAALSAKTPSPDLSKVVSTLPSSLTAGLNISIITQLSDDPILQRKLLDRASEILLPQKIFAFLKVQGMQNFSALVDSEGFSDLYSLVVPDQQLIKGIWGLLTNVSGSLNRRLRMLAMPQYYMMYALNSLKVGAPLNVSQIMEVMPSMIGLTCADVQLIQPMNLLRMLPVYRLMQSLSARARNQALAWIPLSMRRCIHSRMIQYLSAWVPDINQDQINRTVALSMMSVGDVEAVGGLVMALFNASDIAQLPLDVQKAVYRVVGNIPVPTLVTVPLDNMKTLARNAAALLLDQSRDRRLYLSDLQQLGSLMYYLSTDFHRVDPLSLRKLLFYNNQPINKHICAPEETRRTLSKAFISLFGHPENWNDQILANIGGLLLIFNKEELDRINQTALENMADILIRDSPMNLMLPEWYGKQTIQFSEACRLALPSNEIKSYQESIRNVVNALARAFTAGNSANSTTGHQSGIVTCEEMRSAGPLAGWLTEQDIQSVNDKELNQCVETLGLFPWSHDIRSAIWNKLRKFQSNFTGTELLAMGSLVQAISPEEIARIDLTAIDVVSSLGRYRHWTKDQLKAFKVLLEKSQYLQTTNSQGSMLTLEPVLRLTSLQHLVCGLDGKLLYQMLNNQNAYASVILGVFGKLATCSLEALSALATFAQQPGSPLVQIERWTAADLNAIGIIIGGLEPSVAAKIPAEAFQGLQPHTVHVLRPELLKALSPSQLSNIPILVAASFTQKHTSSLVTNQMSAIASAASGYPAEYPKPASAKNDPLFEDSEDDDNYDQNSNDSSNKTSESKGNSASRGSMPRYTIHTILLVFLIKLL